MDNFLPFSILEESTSDDGMFYCKLCGEIFDDNTELLCHSCPKLKERLKEFSKDKSSLKKQNLKIRTSQRIKGKIGQLQQANTHDNGAVSDVSQTDTETSAKNVKSAARNRSSFTDQCLSHKNLVSNRLCSRRPKNKRTVKKNNFFKHNLDCYKKSEESNIESKTSTEAFDEVLGEGPNVKTIVQPKSASQKSLKQGDGIIQDKEENKWKRKLSKNEKKSFVKESYDQILLGNKDQLNHSPQDESEPHVDIISDMLTAKRESSVRSAKLTDDRRRKSASLRCTRRVQERKIFLTRDSKLCDKCGYHVPEDHNCVLINVAEDSMDNSQNINATVLIGDISSTGLSGNNNSTGLSGNISSTGLSGNINCSGMTCDNNSTGLCGNITDTSVCLSANITNTSVGLSGNINCTVLSDNIASKGHSPNEIQYEKSNAESDVEEFNCIQCGQTFFQSNAQVYDNSEVFLISNYSYSIFRCEKCVLLLTFKDKILQKCTTFNLEDFTPLICRTDDKFGCRICNENLTGFSQIDQLSHLLQHAENFSKQCVICQHQIQSSRGLKLHMKKHRVLIKLTKFFRRVVQVIQSDSGDNELTYKVQSLNVTRGQKIPLSNQTVVSKWEPQILNDNTVKLSRVNVVLDVADDINRKRRHRDGESSETKRRKPSPMVNSEHDQIGKDVIIYMSGRDVVDYFQHDKNMDEFLDLTEMDEENLEIINHSEYLKQVSNSESCNSVEENYVSGCDSGSDFGNNGSAQSQGLHQASVLPNQERLSPSSGENSVSSQNIYPPETSHLSSGVTSMADIHVQNDINMVQSNACSLNQIISRGLVDSSKSVNSQHLYGSTSSLVPNDTGFYGNKQVPNVADINVSTLQPQLLHLNGVPNSASYVSHVTGQVVSSSKSGNMHSGNASSQYAQSSSINQLSNILKEINSQSETSDVPCSMTLSNQMSGEPVQSASSQVSSYYEDVSRQLPQYSTRQASEGMTIVTNTSSKVSSSVICPTSQLNQANMPVQNDTHYITEPLSSLGNVDVSRSTPVSIPANMSGQLDQYSEVNRVTVDLTGKDDMSLAQVQSMTPFKIPDNLTEEEELVYLASLTTDYTPFQICSDESHSGDEREAQAIEPEETVSNTNATPSKENGQIVVNFDLASNVDNCAFTHEVEVASVQNKTRVKKRLRMPTLNRDNSGQFQCDMCTLCFKKVDLLFKHQELHEKNPYTCWQCFIKFTSPDKYNGHMADKHT